MSFMLTEREVMDEVLDVDLIHSLALFNMERAKDMGVAEDGVFTALIDTYVDSGWGWKMHIPLSDIFRYKLKDEQKEDMNEAIEIRERIDQYANRVASLLKEETGLPGEFSFEHYEADGSYVLLYREQAEI